MDAKKIKITVENDGLNASFEIHQDSDIHDWKSVFTSILLWITFPPEAIAELFIEE